MFRKKTTKEFIRQAKAKHGRKYDYSETIYTGCFDEIKYICRKHGEKKQVASYHLSGRGCIFSFIPPFVYGLLKKLLEPFILKNRHC